MAIAVNEADQAMVENQEIDPRICPPQRRVEGMRDLPASCRPGLSLATRLLHEASFGLGANHRLARRRLQRPAAHHSWSVTAACPVPGPWHPHPASVASDA